MRSPEFQGTPALTRPCPSSSSFVTWKRWVLRCPLHGAAVRLDRPARGQAVSSAAASRACVGWQYLCVTVAIPHVCACADGHGNPSRPASHAFNLTGSSHRSRAGRAVSWCPLYRWQDEGSEEPHCQGHQAISMGSREQGPDPPACPRHQAALGRGAGAGRR